MSNAPVLTAAKHLYNMTLPLRCQNQWSLRPKSYIFMSSDHTGHFFKKTDFFSPGPFSSWSSSSSSLLSSLHFMSIQNLFYCWYWYSSASSSIPSTRFRVCSSPEVSRVSFYTQWDGWVVPWHLHTMVWTHGTLRHHSQGVEVHKFSFLFPKVLVPWK